MTEMTLVKFKELEETAPVMSDGGGLIVMDRRDVRAAASTWEADCKRLEQWEAEAQDKAHPQIRPMTQLENAYMDLEGKLGQANAHIEALEKEPNEWPAATRHLLEHYPEDVFPPNSNTLDAKAGTFARRILSWLIDPTERARLAALAAGEGP